LIPEPWSRRETELGGGVSHFSRDKPSSVASQARRRRLYLIVFGVCFFFLGGKVESWRADLQTSSGVGGEVEPSLSFELELTEKLSSREPIASCLVLPSSSPVPHLPRFPSLPPNHFERRDPIFSQTSSLERRNLSYDL